MGNLSHTVGGTDNLVSFKSAARVPIDSLKVHFKPIQDGEGDPSPENVRPIRGWNEVEVHRVPEVMPFKVIYKNSTSYNVTFTCDNSGVITANGIPTSYATFMPIEVEVKGNEILYEKIFGNMQNVNITAPFLFDKDGNRIKANLSDSILGKNYGLDLSQYSGVAKVRVGIKRNANNVPMTGSCFIAVTNGASNQQKQYAAWNQWAKPLTEENWQVYNTSNNEVTFENGIVTSKWLQNKIGYQASIRTKVGISQKNKEIWYVSYMVKPSITTLSWGAEYNGGLQHTFIEQAEANEWIQCSGANMYWKGNQNFLYFSYCRDNTKDLTGLTAQIKAPVAVNLTQMFGYGNEPTKEEFEAECVLNGFDLTTYIPYNEGQVIEWKTNRTILKQTIPVSIPGKNLFNINAQLSEPSATDENASSSRVFIPYTYCFGLSQSNYYYPNRIQQFSVSNNEISFVSTNTSYGVGYALPLSYGSYTIRYTGNNIKHLIVSYDENGFPIAIYTTGNATFRVSKKSAISIILFLPQSANSTATASNIKVEEGIKANTYSPFDPDNSVYGGYVDLAKGEVVQNWNKYILTGDETFYESGNWVTTFVPAGMRAHDLVESMRGVGFCSHYPYSPYSRGKIGVMYGEKTITFDGSIHDADGWKLYCQEQYANGTPITICYPLKDPISYPLTPTELKAFLGDNTFWSNTNDVTEVSYAIHDTASIRAAKKRIIAASPKLETVSGDLVTFNTDVAAKLKECKVEFKPKQDLHGYDRPWIGGAGKNLFNENAIIYGTWTNADGSIRSSSPPGCRTEDIAVNPGETYTAMYNGEQPYSESLIELDENKNFILRTHIAWQGTSNPSVLHVTLTENTRYIYLQVYHHNSGTNTMTKDVLSTYRMQLEKSSVATSYEPYENICPIEGWNELEIIKTGKNLLENDHETVTRQGVTWTVNSDGTVHVERTAEGNSFSFMATVSAHQFLKGNITYHLSGGNTDANLYLGGVDIDGVSFSENITGIDTGNGTVFTLSKDSKARYQAVVKLTTNVNTDIYPMLTIDNSSDEYEPYNGTTIPITFPAEAGTIYGGYVDLINGEIVQEYELVADTWSNIKYSSVNSTTGYQYGRLFFKNPVVKAGTSGAANVSYCNVGKYAWNLTSNATPHFYIDTIGNTETTYIAYITLPSTTDDNLLITCAAKLINPIAYPLNSQTLKALRGTNNIWSNSNGPITIKYWKH